MRIITIHHRDQRGTVHYPVYETPEQLLAQEPQAKVVYSLNEAQKGCYVVSANGWVVPLLAITRMQDKYIRRNRGFEQRRTPRKTTFEYVIFHFPKDRKCFRADKLEQAVFNYTPRTMDCLAGEGKRDRTYELSARKLYWARLVVEGWDIEQATRQAFPRARNYNALLKRLLNNEKLMQLINGKNKAASLAQSLEERGITTETIATRLVDMVQNPASRASDKRWAIDVVMKILGVE